MYYLQGKAERVKPPDLLSLLQDVYRDKVVLRRRHEEGARLVSSYEFNNAYQYVLNREDTHLEWLRAAIQDAGAEPVEPSTSIAVPGGKGAAAGRAIIEDDARTAREFVERWQPRVAAVTHARHRKMLDLLLGEASEQQRSFEQALAGRDDLLGRRPAGAGTGGGVMPTRWIE